MVIRTGIFEDRDELEKLWKLSFNDEDEFISWFFNNRFNPEYISLAECDGKIVSVMHSLPVNVRVRDNVFNGILISGVATLPEYRRRGYMHGVMRYHIQRMKNCGHVISVLKAVKPEIYYSLDHRIINDLKIVDLNNAYADNNCEVINIDNNLAALYKCYQSYSKKYSCLFERTYDDFSLKFSEYIACGAGCVAVMDESSINGYCIYYNENDKLCAEELVALSDSSYSEIINALVSVRASDKKIKLPSDIKSSSEFTFEITYGNSGYPIDVAVLLRSLGLKGYSIEISDNVISDNSCRYTLSGDITYEQPNIKISAGFLLQWIVGYKSMSELIDDGQAKLVNDQGIVSYMDSVGKKHCFSIDEY